MLSVIHEGQKDQVESYKEDLLTVKTIKTNMAQNICLSKKVWYN